ncbi:MAG: hypothetical protein Kow00103_07110 [Candidatus Caldatribacteriota bacterium]
MIKVRVILTGYLKNRYFEVKEMKYSNPIKISQVIEDAKISNADVYVVVKEGRVVKYDDLLTTSSEIKLIPVIGGG